ncbi:uncharacterized protein LOC117319322 isoform X1 [Pecten maximus]|uniref:uncharacterized protein LOC117319322 isoform X1 n=1 Tax=Pecten maximus TaxID=6579 RepID=UPI0014590116|nr:uncharacterized protein LOC117319322 isoform X1 [Pecten maximus]
MLDIFVITGTFIVARQSFSFISSQTCVLRHQYTDAGRWLSCGYRERKKNDENYEQKERERKKTARANRTEEQIQTDNIKSKERQKRWTTDHLFSFIQTRKESGRRDVSGMLLCMMMLLGSSTPQTSSCMDQDHSTYLRTCRKCDLSLSTCSTPDINIFLPQLRSQQTSTEHPGICQFMLHVILKHYGISSASICKLIVQV